MSDRGKIETPHIYRLSVSPEKGQKKINVKEVEIKTNMGIDGDAHSDSFRAVSLLPYESFAKLDHPKLEINPGDFAENITTIGIDFKKLAVGSRVALGKKVILEIVQIGKECHNGCIIRQTVGDCIMPREGIFARTLQGGHLKEGDQIRILK